MSPLCMIRRFHAPLACLAIVCVVSAGCRSNQETVSLGQPKEAYRADNGSLLFGYYVQPPLKPADAGWHWLIIDSDTTDLILQGTPSGADFGGSRIIAVSYEGWSRNARLVPPLLEPGLTDRTPPVIGDGGLIEQGFVWDHEMGGMRLLVAGGSAMSIVRVSPDFKTHRVWEYNTEIMLDILRVAAIAGLVVGLVALGGSVELSNH